MRRFQVIGLIINSTSAMHRSVLRTPSPPAPVTPDRYDFTSRVSWGEGLEVWGKVVGSAVSLLLAR